MPSLGSAAKWKDTSAVGLHNSGSQADAARAKDKAEVIPASGASLRESYLARWLTPRSQVSHCASSRKSTPYAPLPWPVASDGGSGNAWQAEQLFALSVLNDSCARWIDIRDQKRHLAVRKSAEATAAEAAKMADRLPKPNGRPADDWGSELREDVNSPGPYILPSSGILPTTRIPATVLARIVTTVDRILVTPRAHKLKPPSGPFEWVSADWTPEQDQFLESPMPCRLETIPKTPPGGRVDPPDGSQRRLVPQSQPPAVTDDLPPSRRRQHLDNDQGFSTLASELESLARRFDGDGLTQLAWCVRRLSATVSQV